MSDSQTSDISQSNDSQLLAATWDLSHILAGNTSDPAQAVDSLLNDADRLSEDFAQRYAGKIATLDGPTLITAMKELEALFDLVARAGSYAALDFSADTTDPQRGALMQKMQERGTAVETKTLFFELEWAAIDDERADQLLATDGLDFCRHHLHRARRYRPYLLSEPEEKIISEKALSGRNAWSRLFEEQTATIEVNLKDQPAPVTLEAALSQLYSPDRETRRETAEGVTEALANDGLRTRAFILNTLLADKMVEDRLRKYPHWLASRNLANEASDESVQALVDSVRNRYELPRRWYRLKAQILGLDRLADYDRMAPIINVDEHFTWTECCDLVTDSYQAFSPELGSLTKRFIDERWIDAPPSKGKRGGAFCAPTVPQLHPYVLLNYTGRRRDVLTLAHELGHGVHFSLAAEQGMFHMSTPLTLAETASTFGEKLVFSKLLEQVPNPESKLSLLADSIEGSIATIFRQIAMYEFERLIHTERRGQGELSLARLNELWAQSQSELLGDSVEITEGYHSWWSYVPHFIGSPGYVYAYAYGQLVALAIYSRYQEVGEAFVPSYLDLLRAGGSRTPEELVQIAGIDITDTKCWESGLNLLEEQISEAEQAALRSGLLKESSIPSPV